VALGDGRDWATSSSLTVAFVVTLAVAIGGVAAAGRLPRRLPGLDAAAATVTTDAAGAAPVA
jgi:multidrug efflux pump subunit AcrB